MLFITIRKNKFQPSLEGVKYSARIYCRAWQRAEWALHVAVRRPAYMLRSYLTKVMRPVHHVRILRGQPELLIGVVTHNKHP